MPTVADILAAVDRLAPFRQAEEWDNVGLILGDADRRARRVLVALDASDAVCQEAERLRADCLVVHHPLIFHGVKRLTGDTRTGRVALRLLAGRRALIVAHTNLDGATGGLCDLLGRLVGLEDLEPLQHPPPPSTGPYGQGRCKIVVFVPAGDPSAGSGGALEAVRAAAFAAGAGHIGLYTECSFASEGEGTFLPGERARPAVGKRGRRSAVREARLEVLVDEARLARVLAAVARAHPYEEPAIDVYPLKAVVPGAGIGRVGRLRRPTSAGCFAETVKRALRRQAVGFAGDPRQRLHRVALCTGSGGGVLAAVRAARADAYLTGELAMHEVQELEAFGIATVLGGHYETERIPLNAWAPRLARSLKGIDVRLSRAERGVPRIR
ncbi:MAG: Nif3-like dinuclear metal center hexameric protein [Planctomycetes bacterium]|nr:Nif3-like dinuclear metal center hexameric protein [Planctomycetota bacterium]